MAHASTVELHDPKIWWQVSNTWCESFFALLTQTSEAEWIHQKNEAQYLVWYKWAHSFIFTISQHINFSLEYGSVWEHLGPPIILWMSPAAYLNHSEYHILLIHKTHHVYQNTSKPRFIGAEFCIMINVQEKEKQKEKVKEEHHSSPTKHSITCQSNKLVKGKQFTRENMA